MCRNIHLCLGLILFQFQITVLARPRLRMKIVGGTEASIEEFPYQVALEVQQQLVCGGSIIGQKYILTAAHCLDGVKISRINIRAGSTLLQTSGEIRQVKKSIVHEFYNNQTSDYDVTILELTEPFNFSNKINSIPLPNASEKIVTSQVGIISGWGHLKEDGMKSKTLQKVGVPVIPREKCVNAYEKEFLITPRMFCAGYLNTGGRDACQGDSGGPFNFNHKLFGVTSWGVGCADKNFPGVYLNISTVRNWIYNQTGI